MKPLILMPSRGAVSVETLLCIDEHIKGYPLLTVHRLPVVTARNILAKSARKSKAEFLLWLDDDIWFTREHVDTAVAILEDNLAVDMVAGMYSNRCAYGDSNCLMPEDYRKSIAPMALKPDELASVAYCGFGFVLMRRTLLDRVGDNPFDRLPIETVWEWPLRDIPGRMAEDFSFCKRVLQCGGKIVTEKSLVLGHVDVQDGQIYFPYREPLLANGADRPLPLAVSQASYRTVPRLHDYDMASPKGAA
jgi:hypothetical protein